MKSLKQQPHGYFGFKSCLYSRQPQLSDATVYQSAYFLLQDTTIVYIYTVVVSCNAIQTGFETEIAVILLFHFYSVQVELAHLEYAVPACVGSTFK